jgi:hypothetical protein
MFHHLSSGSDGKARAFPYFVLPQHLAEVESSFSTQHRHQMAPEFLPLPNWSLKMPSLMNFKLTY